MRQRVLFALILSILVAAGCGRFDYDAMEKMAAQEALDPGAYETSIRDVDLQVFGGGDLDPARRQAVSLALGALADRMGRPEANDLVRHFAGALRTLARRVERRGSAAELQRQWMRIRANVFDDASWFARSEADL